MNQSDRALSFLGLAARARKIISGEEMVVKGIQQGKVQLVIVATDASDNTKKKLRDKSSYYEVPFFERFEREALGHSIGKEARVVLGITDLGFSKQLEKLLE